MTVLDKTFSASEAQKLAEIRAAEERGEDVFGDDDDDADVQPVAAVESDTAEEAADDVTDVVDADEAPADVPENTPADDETANQEDAQPEPEAAAPAPLPTYQVGDVEALKAERKSVRKEIAAIDAQWAAGDLSDEARAEALEGLTDKLDDLLVKITRQETLSEANAQAEEREQKKILEGIRVAGKAAGLDYADQALAREFDGIMQGQYAANPSLSVAELAQRTHKAMLAIHGKTAAPAPAATPAPAARTKPPAPPMTLRNLPSAASSNAGGDGDIMAGLSGADFEAKWATLSPAARAKLLDE